MSDKSVLLLEIFREEGQIKVSAQEGTGLEARTLHYYEYKSIDWKHLDAACAEVFQVMSSYNRDGRLAEQSLAELKRLGSLLLDELFPPGTKEQLLSSRSEDMVIRIDDGLVQIPWELLHDGETFFCLRWNVGRLVRTPQKLYRTIHRELLLPLKMILIADPRGDLPAAYMEGQHIRDMIDTAPGKIEVDLLSHRVEARAVLGLLKESDVLHYAGHAEHIPGEPSLSGWLVKGGRITAAEIIGRSGGQGVPSLVFVNGCSSGQTKEWRIQKGGGGQEIFGLANAFLVAGARHYVGTFWEIQDELSNRFAMRFYAGLLAGGPVGACVREAREEIIQNVGDSAIIWATYMLYGDPSFVYVKEQLRAEAAHKETAPGEGLHEGGFKDQEEMPLLRGEATASSLAQPGTVLHDATRPAGLGRWLPSSVTAGLCLLLLILAGGMFLHSYRKGVRETALLLNRTEEDYYSKQDLRDLLTSYRKVLDSGEASRGQVASLNGRLGRIYARNGDLQNAMQHYEAALAIDPADRITQSNLCMALNRMGRYEQASNCTDSLLSMDPSDSLALSLHRELENRLTTENDRARKERIGILVDRLSERAEGEDLAAIAPEEDIWTSRPTALAILKMEDHGGLSARDGQTDAVLQAMFTRLQESSRVMVVDRYLMEEVLKELDLGTGKLSDPAFALRLGRLFAARVIGHGSVYRDKNTLRVNMRFTETETTSLKVAVSHTFPRGTSIEEMGTVLAEAVLKQLKEKYPLHGQVVSADGPADLILSLGKGVGLAEGTVLEVIPPNANDPSLSFARLRVTSVGEDKARAMVLESSAPVIPGCRVLELPGDEE